MTTVKDRFLAYVTQYTTSDAKSETYPSTNRQLDFAEKLKAECIAIGLSDVLLDQYGYVTATLPSNIETPIPIIGFLSHMDTSDEASGENVTPQVIENYNGGIISRPMNPLSPEDFPSLLAYTGDTIITSDGSTLLGADDKAGIAEIMTAMESLVLHPEIPHGTIRIGFTPDEEIGRGVDYFDVKRFGAAFAYTVDGGKLGELEYENFNAARAIVTITGKSVHPGAAKDVMINASLLGTTFSSMLPPAQTPQKTSGFEGFYHLISFSGSVSQAQLYYILRDFEKQGLEQRKQMLQTIAAELSEKYHTPITVALHDEYENMAPVIKNHPEIISLAKKAMEQCQISPIIQPIRGGTDGARLSFLGLPCPNLFTGGHNFHGPYEYIPLSSMEKAVECIIAIIKLAAQN